MLCTRDPRKSASQVGPELATVQVSPYPLFAMIVDSTRLATLRTREGRLTGIVTHQDPDAHLLYIQLNASDLPGGIKPQNATV
jgi:hypothetical protein